MTGLAPHTAKIYPAVAALECIRPYRLVGGTALSLQINHRLSEDLDFCKWVDSSSAANAIAFRDIEAELVQVFSHVNINHLSFDHIDFRVYGVKVTFFNEVGYHVPCYEPINIGNIGCVPVDVLCAMKIKTMFERSVFRDYYDVYSIIRDDLVEPEQALKLALEYDTKLKRESIIKRLTLWRKFRDEKKFSILSPKYNVLAKDIGEYFTSRFK